MPAKGTSKFRIDPEVLEKAETLAGQGLTQDQIADVLGISPATLYKYKKLNTEFAEAIRKGQAKGIATVANALFQQAKRGNVTAQIFFLKNRASDQWKDRHDIHNTHRKVDAKDIDSEMTPQEAAEQYSETLRNGTSGKVVPIKKRG